ncbi:MAG: hypothetical protein RR623_09455 [Bacilli bacterium]
MIIKIKNKGKTKELELIKQYEDYSLFQIYKIENNKKIQIYTECYSHFELEKMQKSICKEDGLDERK